MSNEYKGKQGRMSGRMGRPGALRTTPGPGHHLSDLSGMSDDV